VNCRRESVQIVSLVALSALALVAAPFLGPPLSEDVSDFIFWQLRVPRTLMAAVVGGTLSLVGAVYQTLFFNALASPSTVGTTAGATLGALIAIVYGLGRWAGGISIVVLFAFIGALAASLVVTMVAARERMRINDIILVGIACSLSASALSSGILASADASEAAAAVRWSIGHLPHVGYRSVLLMLPIAGLSALALLGLSRSLDTLAAGEEVAYSRGVRIALVRATAIGCGSLGVAGCVAWCGPIAFVELIVPHIVRLRVGVRRRVVLPMSMVVGAAFLALCDAAARTVLAGRELPVGVITAALGAPALLYLVARQPR
jgi:iron complex transport system permease protein